MADDNNKTNSLSPEYPKPQEKPKKEEEKDLTKKIGDKMKEEAGEEKEKVNTGDETIGEMVQENTDFIKPEDKEEIGAEREEIVNEAGKDVGKFKQGVEKTIDGKSEKETPDNAKREWEKFKKRQESEELYWTNNAMRKELEQKIEELSARKLEVEKLINDFNSVGKENKNRDLIDSYKKEKEELETRLRRLNYRLKTMPEQEQIPAEESNEKETEEDKEIENIISKVKKEGKITPEEGEFILKKIQEKESEFYEETSKEEREKLGKEFLKYEELDEEEKKRREVAIEEAKKKFTIDAGIEAENKEKIDETIGELQKEMKEKFENYAKMDEELRAIYESEDTAGRKELGPVSDQMKEVFKYRLKFAKLDYLRQSLTDKNAESIEEQIKDPEALLNSCDRRKTEIEKYEKVIAMMDKKFEELSEEEKSFFEKLLKWIKHNPKKTALIAVLLVAGVMIAPHAMPYITAENLGKLAIAGGAVVALKKFKPQLKKLAEIGGTAAIVGLLLLNDNWGSVDDFAEWACGMKIPTWAKRFEDKSKK